MRRFTHSILSYCGCVILLAYLSQVLILHCIKHKRMGGGGGLGAHATPNFYGRAKINAKFGQNIKISEKFWCPEKIFVSLRKLRDVGKIFWYVRQNFRMFVEKYLVCPENFFLYVHRKKILVTSPPARQQFWGDINVQFACSGKLYCAPLNKIRPIRPWSLLAIPKLMRGLGTSVKKCPN
jgi:hypothetical protein